VKVRFEQSFVKDLHDLDAKRAERVRNTIQLIETAASLRDVPHLMKLQGYSDFFRVRVGDYRLGLAIIQGEIVFVRCLPRKDIYRYFP
jgi:mRNA interferase RelE/StbE